jgi:isoleucyl-tRNA synthetase
VIDTELTPELVAEGDARELQRAVQDLRKQAGLELDDLVELWLAAGSDVLAPVEPFLVRLAEEVHAHDVRRSAVPPDALAITQAISTGEVTIAIRRVPEG